MRSPSSLLRPPLLLPFVWLLPVALLTSSTWFEILEPIVERHLEQQTSTADEALTAVEGRGYKMPKKTTYTGYVKAYLPNAKYDVRDTSPIREYFDMLGRNKDVLNGEALAQIRNLYFDELAQLVRSNSEVYEDRLPLEAWIVADGLVNKIYWAKESSLWYMYELAYQARDVEGTFKHDYGSGALHYDLLPQAARMTFDTSHGDKHNGRTLSFLRKQLGRVLKWDQYQDDKKFLAQRFADAYSQLRQASPEGAQQPKPIPTEVLYVWLTAGRSHITFNEARGHLFRLKAVLAYSLHQLPPTTVAMEQLGPARLPSMSGQHELAGLRIAAPPAHLPLPGRLQPGGSGAGPSLPRLPYHEDAPGSGDFDPPSPSSSSSLTSDARSNWGQELRLGPSH